MRALHAGREDQHSDMCMPTSSDGYWAPGLTEAGYHTHLYHTASSGPCLQIKRSSMHPVHMSGSHAKHVRLIQKPCNRRSCSSALI